MTNVNNLEEVSGIPGRDGTGPLGAGPMTGRGSGFCKGANVVSYGGPGLGSGPGPTFRRGGVCRGFAINEAAPETQSFSQCIRPAPS